MNEIYASEFFKESLAVVHYSKGIWQQKVIDNTIGRVFDVEVTSLNGNGDKALLVTNHINKTSKSAVFAYEIPNDIVQGTFIKHTLWSGIKTVKKGFGQASPGNAMSFSISENNTEKPYILVAGDGAENATVLTPNSRDKNDWSYNPVEIFKSNANSVIGKPAMLNANADHGVIAFIPEYDNNQIHIFELSE